MAKIKYGTVVAGAAGKLDGIVLSHNQYGRYVRIRVVGTNPRSSKQTAVRNFFGSTSAAWRSLSEATRNAWKAAAEGVTRVNNLGDVYQMTGANYYMSVNRTRELIGLAVSPGPPAPGILPTFGSTLTFEALDDGTFTITGPVTTTGGAKFLVYATVPYSAGRTYVKKSQYKFIGDLASVTNIVTATSAYGALFTLSDANIGQKVSVKLVPCDPQGYTGAAVELTTTVGGA